MYVIMYKYFLKSIKNAIRFEIYITLWMYPMEPNNYVLEFFLSNGGEINTIHTKWFYKERWVEETKERDLILWER